MARTRTMFPSVIAQVVFTWGRILFCLWLGANTVLGEQRFEERPQNVSVVQGDTVVMKCSVHDRSGRVQWVKDGFALGYDREIPGYPTYSVIGSNSRQFNLMVTRTRLRDDAQYQCQVTPGGPGHPRLVASAFLTVLVPCEAPTIRGYDNGSTVEIPHTRGSLQLICEARNGKPAPEIEWYRNDKKVVRDVLYETVPIVGDKRTDARSTLSLSLRGNSENGAVYRCQAKNSAMRGRPLATAVTISILYPPGPPKITGYSSGEEIRSNSTVRLVCTSEGGNPLGTVVWFRNGRRVDSSFTSGANRAINDFTITALPIDNGATYRCDVTNHVTDRPLSSSVTLTVLFPPERVSITGGSGALRAGKDVILTCLSSHSYPKAAVTWFAHGRQIPSANVTTIYRPSPEGGVVTHSKVTVTLTHHEHDVIYTCQATNDVGQTVADTVTLSVLYPPEPPTISGYTDGTPLRASQTERMTCIAVGGNPRAILKWYKNGRLVQDAVYKVMGEIAQSDIVVVAQPDDNGARYTCTASNDATTTTGPLEASVRMTVLFPPASVTITVSTDQPRAGRGLNLTCVSSSSNPAAEMTWMKAGHRIEGVPRGVVNAQHGGKNTTNVLHLIPTSSDHRAAYACRATNTLLGQSVTDAVTLSVLFPPEFSRLETAVINLTAGDSRSLNLSAYANPPVSSYRLYRDGIRLSLSDDSSSFHLSNRGILKISKVTNEEKGRYTVRADNDQGSTDYTFSINVRYKAAITDITNRVLEDVGGTAFFECVVDANPVTPNMITWTRPGYDMNAKTKQRREGSKSYLTVYDLVRSDTGTFKCVADNGIGQPVTRNAKLIVKYAPIIDKSPENSKAASEKGETATLTCRAEGAPDVSFTWYKDNQPLDTSSTKYQTSSDKSRLVHFESALRVRAVAREDYGNYNCTATNSKGMDSFLISLHGTSKPDPPYDLQFVNATHNTITLAWKPGFNGGLEQSFRVRYKPIQARGYIYVDVSVPLAPVFTMTGLKLGTEYEMTVLAFNSLGESPYQTDVLVARTSNVMVPTDISTSELQGSDEVPVIIILVVCIVGVFLLTLNVGLILFFVRRRKKRLESNSDTSHTNAFELYGATKKEGTLYPITSSDDCRGYGTYDKSTDDLSEGFSRDFESEYVSRCFTPCDVDSPCLTSHKTYLMDGYGRHSPWLEDPYHASLSENKTGDMYGSEDPLYDNRTYPRSDTRPKSIAELSERPSSRTGKVVPPLPTRSTSRGDHLPPVPARHYGTHEVQPRYAPPPGSVSPNVVPNPNYTGPPAQYSPSHSAVNKGSEMKGHLV